MCWHVMDHFGVQLQPWNSHLLASCMPNFSYLETSMHLLLGPCLPSHLYWTFQPVASARLEVNSCGAGRTNIHYTLFTIHYPLYTLHNTLYMLQYTIFTVHLTLPNIHYNLYTIHFSLYIIYQRLWQHC